MNIVSSCYWMLKHIPWYAARGKVNLPSRKGAEVIHEYFEVFLVSITLIGNLCINIIRPVTKFGVFKFFV